VTDKLTLYNLALGLLNERKLVSLNQQVEARRVLDDFFPSVQQYCLERKLWNFLLRTVHIDASTTITPAFGFGFAFTIPDDWVRTLMVSAHPSLRPPLNNYQEETGFWYANETPLFIKYSSKDPLYGLDLGAWPASFEDYVSLRLAAKACGRITGKSELLPGKDGLLQREKDAYKVCSANCAMNGAVGFAPVSSWIRSRSGPPGDYPEGSLLG
jgi:hypothetical protein